MSFFPMLPHTSLFPDLNYEAIASVTTFYSDHGQAIFNILTFLALCAMLLLVSRNRGTKMTKTPAVKARDVEDWIVTKIEDKVFREEMDTKLAGEFYEELAKLLELPGLINNYQRQRKKQIKARLRRKNKEGETLYRNADGERKVLQFPDRADMKCYARNALDALTVKRKSQQG